MSLCLPWKIFTLLGSWRCIKNCYYLINSQLNIRHKKQSPCKTFLCNRADTPKIKAYVKEFHQTFLNKYPVDDVNSYVNEMWSCIQSNLLTLLENKVPSKLSSSKSLPPWINNETKSLIRNKKIWYKKAKTRNNSESWKTYSEHKRETQKQLQDRSWRLGSGLNRGRQN